MREQVESRDAATDETHWVRFNRALETLAAAGISWEIREEVYDAAMDLMHGERHRVLNSLVIGIYDDGSFPHIERAVVTTTAVPLKVDECDHRDLAEGAVVFEEMGADREAESFRTFARGMLAADLGDTAEGDRLMNEAHEMVSGGAA